MTNERTQCALASIDLLEQTAKHNYEKGWAGAAIAGSLLEVAGVLDSAPHLHSLVGKPKAEKTTLALSIAQSWAESRAPWDRADEARSSHSSMRGADRSPGTQCG